MLNRKTTAGNVWSCFGVCVAGSAFSMWMVGPSHRLAGVAMSLGIFAGLAWLLIIPMLCQDIRLQWEVGDQFIKDLKSTFLFQEIVDARLNQLAKAFEKVCSAQVKLQGTESAESVLDQFEKDLSIAKSAFWSAHREAKFHGYKVKPKVSDYFRLPVVHDTEAA